MVGVKLAAVVALGAVLTACNGASDAAPEPSPSPSVVAASPSPSPSPEPSPSPTEVLPANDVADPVEALEAIVRFRDELFEDPDPEKLALIYAERCPCYEELLPIIEAFVSEGTHVVVEVPRRFKLIEIVERNAQFADIRYSVTGVGARVVGADGNTQESRPASEEETEERALMVREGGRWVVVSYA